MLEVAPAANAEVGALRLRRSGEGVRTRTSSPAAAVFMTRVIFKSTVSPRTVPGTNTTAPSSRTMPRPSLEYPSTVPVYTPPVFNFSMSLSS